MGLVKRNPPVLKSFKVNGSKDTYIIRIATEGAVTEKQYFESELMGQKCPRISVEVLPTVNGCSTPTHIFNRIQQSIEKDKQWAADQYWVVFDVDQHSDIPVILNSIKAFNRSAVSKVKIQVAISNPRFEVWLALHQRLSLQANDIKKLTDKPEVLVNKIMPYSSRTKTIRMDHLSSSFVAFAVKQAEQLDTNKQADIPDAPGTRVYRLVKEILKIIS